MSAMSNYLEDALVNFVLRNNPDTFASPGTSIYVGLIKYYDAAVVEQGTLTQEASGGSYARVQVTAWDDPSGGGATQNTSAITFPTATGDWGGISGVIIADAASAGNVLLHGSLTSARDVKNGDVFKFNAGDLDVTFA
tara:strand:- start:1658 stop:2071 length:414 start_codon:yes stop_codon:yes gene_type:complete